MKEKKLDIRKYINHQNRTLYKKLADIYDIKLYLSPELNSWEVDNNKPIIRTPKDDLNIASFTHELLHIYLDYLGITHKEDIYYKLFNADVLLSINRALLFDHIYNVSSHKKMYPFFRDMGFQDKDFVNNNGVFLKRIDYLVITICKNLNILSKLWISQFIGHFLALKNDIIKSHNQHNRKYLYKLAKLDRSLYHIIYDFDSKWSKQISLNCWDNYRKLSDDLFDWLKKNKKLKK
jgi:predicted metal-dependent peptidase